MTGPIVLPPDDELELVPLHAPGDGAPAHLVPNEVVSDIPPPHDATLADLGARQLGDPPVAGSGVAVVAAGAAGPLDGALSLGGAPVSAAAFVRLLLVLVAGALLGVVALNVAVDPLGIVHRDAAGALSEEPSYRIWKRELVDRLASPPQVVLLGSSTMRDLDPRLVGQAAHRTAFNASVVGGSPLDAWVLDRRLRSRFPKAPLHLVYGVDVDLTFRDVDPSPALLRDAGLRAQLGTRELVGIGATVLRPYVTLSMTRTSLRMLVRHQKAPAQTADDVFRADGYRRLDPYRHAHLRLRLPRETERFADLVYRNGTGDTLGAMPRRNLERLVVDANRHGDTPTFVLMPIQPWAAAQLGPMGQARRHALVLGWFRQLGRRHHLRVVDLADIVAFRGSPSGFRDNVHLAPDNAASVVRELAARGAFAELTRGVRR